MNRYLVEISAMMVVDSEYSSDDVAIGIAARLEEIAQSNAHLLDYEVLPYEMPEPYEPPHQRKESGAGIA
jgi:hypothetical protein